MGKSNPSKSLKLYQHETHTSSIEEDLTEFFMSETETQTHTRQSCIFVVTVHHDEHDNHRCYTQIVV